MHAILPGVNDEPMRRIAELLRERNAIDEPRAEQIERGVTRGTAASVTKRQWAAAEVYPASSSLLPISSRQAELLQL